jgi:hypothetical protein
MDAMQARAQTWQRRLEDQLDSGQSIAVWCRNNGCSRQTFYRWQARLGQGASEASAAGFTEIHLAPPTAQPPDLQTFCSQPLHLRLIGGRELWVPMAMPAASLAQLLCALESLQPSGACPEVLEGACPEVLEGGRP